jgi:hypothetical protein
MTKKRIMTEQMMMVLALWITDAVLVAALVILGYS